MDWSDSTYRTALGLLENTAFVARFLVHRDLHDAG